MKVEKKEGEQKREIELGDEEGGRCGKSDGDTEEEHHEHRETTVTKRTEISFNKKLSSQSYNFPFIVGEGERSGRGDASRCFARTWAVTPVLVNLTTP